MNKNSAQRLTLLSTAFAAALSLAACGGGGGPSSPTAAAPAPAPAPAPAAINTTPQVSTYAAGSPEDVVFKQLNAERGSCGFGFLKQSVKLDVASQDTNVYFGNRAAESLSSALAFDHGEDGSKSGFTGVFPRNRVAFRSYPFTDTGGNVGEDYAAAFSKPASAMSNPALAISQINQLLTSVYHAGDLMRSWTEVGVAFARVTTADGYDASRLNIVVAVPTGDARQVSTTVRTYPCAGTTRVSPTFMPSTESPNPAPDLGAATIGTPVYINGPEGQTLTVTAAAIAPTSGGTAVASRVLNYNNDPVFTGLGVHALKSNEAYVLPLTPLVKGSAYTVTVSGDSNGVAFTQTFAFTPSL